MSEHTTTSNTTRIPPAQCDQCDQPTAAHHADRVTMQFCLDGTPEGVWQCQSCGGMTSGTAQ